MSNVYRIIGRVVIGEQAVLENGDIVLLECRMRETSAVYRKDADGENSLYIVNNNQLRETSNEQYPVTTRFRLVAMGRLPGGMVNGLGV
jgi:hypothetical protein